MGGWGHSYNCKHIEGVASVLLFSSLASVLTFSILPRVEMIAFPFLFTVCAFGFLVGTRHCVIAIPFIHSQMETQV